MIHSTDRTYVKHITVVNDINVLVSNDTVCKDVKTV